jgi:hypothetical protein
MTSACSFRLVMRVKWPRDPPCHCWSAISIGSGPAAWRTENPRSPSRHPVGTHPRFARVPERNPPLAWEPGPGMGMIPNPRQIGDGGGDGRPIPDGDGGPIPDLPTRRIGGPSPPPSPICRGLGIIPIPGSHRGFRALVPRQLAVPIRPSGISTGNMGTSTNAKT